MTQLTATCSNEYSMSINFSCYPDTKENAHIVNWNELNPVSYPDSLGVVENNEPEFVGYSHYQPEPYIIRNGSNFHATLSHEGLVDSYGCETLINLDQNLMTEDLPLKQGQIFVLQSQQKTYAYKKSDIDGKLSYGGVSDERWREKLGDEEWERLTSSCDSPDTECIFIKSTIRDLYGRKVVSIDYLRIEDWEGHIDYNGNVIEPVKNMTVKELMDNANFINASNMVAQAGKILPAFRYNEDINGNTPSQAVGIIPTPNFYDFGDRDLFADMAKHDLQVKKQLDNNVQKKMIQEKKELAKKQQNPMEMFF
jgi:hypothetical protein